SWMPVYNDTVSALRYLPLEQATGTALPRFAPGLLSLAAFLLAGCLLWNWTYFALHRIFFECFRSSKKHMSEKDESPVPPGSEPSGPSVLRALRRKAEQGEATSAERWLICELERRPGLDAIF